MQPFLLNPAILKSIGNPGLTSFIGLDSMKSLAMRSSYNSFPFSVLITTVFQPDGDPIEPIEIQIFYFSTSLN